MASRRETREQQRGVEQALRAMLGGGALGQDGMLPSVSELAQEHGVSRYIAHRALQTLEEEGLFRAVPKVGSFAPSTKALTTHVVLTDAAAPHPYRSQIQLGFESRIAAHGGVAVSWEGSHPQEWRELPLSGAFLLDTHERFEGASLGENVPMVRIGSDWREGEHFDLVSFSDEDGGALATNHLLHRGLKSIAFLGLHVPTRDDSAKKWSLERENGWRRSLREAGLPFHGLAFSPDQEEANDADGARRIGRSYARSLAERGDVRGVVAANDAVALGLLDGLREARIARREWPAIVAFDNSEAARRHNITSLHLPWDELGREAADLLWSRSNGVLPPQPQHRAVPMRLIPRLSCHNKWPSLAPL